MRAIPLAVGLASIAIHAGALPAQQTWQITAAELPATVAAAAPGDILLVTGQAWLLPGLTIRKPLSIHGAAGAAITAVPDGLLIEDIARGQTVTFQGFAMAGAIHVRRCAGTVLLADLAASASIQMIVEDSLDVAVESCRFATNGYGGGVTIAVANSSLTLSQSEVKALGYGRGSPHTPRPAVAAVNSWLRVARSRLTGGFSDLPPLAAQPAVLLTSSTMRVSGATTTVEAGWNNFMPVSAIDGTGTLVLDPAATLIPMLGAPGVGPGIAVVPRAHPTTSVTPSAIGGTSTIVVHGNANDACWLLFGLPGLPESYAGVFGELRIGAHLGIAAMGQLDGNGEFRLTFPVPAIPSLRAIVFRWQGVTGNAAATFLAEPGTECHR